MLTVSGLAKRCGVSTDTVRYYARVGLLLPERDSVNGYKIFNRSDVSRMNFIRRAKLLGFSLSEISEIIRHGKGGESPCPLVRKLIEKKILENRMRLGEMAALQGRMESAMKKWQALPDGVPDGDSICHLIESFEYEP